MYGDQSGEFVCGYWGLRVKPWCYKLHSFVSYAIFYGILLWSGLLILLFLTFVILVTGPNL